MKTKKGRAIVLMLILAFAILLSSCSSDYHEASTLHNIDGVIISLGESKGSIEKRLGVGKPDENDYFHYSHNTISVHYLDNKASVISVEGKGWYMFDDVGVGMASEDLKEVYPDNDIYNPILFDKNSKITKLPGEAVSSVRFICGGLKLMYIDISYAE